MLSQIYPQTDHPFSFELNKDMHVSAAHFIPREDAGACSRVHGHTYTINITIAGDELDESGFLVNFSTLKKSSFMGSTITRCSMIMRNSHQTIDTRCQPLRW
ncbi:hypothetical protein BsIDN1_24450 [Bacillus safensis]|uniref:6-carboxy-5,6,7,8-tetrahydropterin synthase n=1 Tax=Bacillus safensis TaxID=561879 RepID=A0A5S9M5P0_BACIA|nr:hypothetical protein BsIDN1_24450 [Bacillus safensis]